MTREHPPVALFAHDAAIKNAAREQLQSKTLQRRSLQINYSINGLGRTRCAGPRGSPTGGAHREQMERPKSGRVRTTAGQKPKPRSVPQKICHPPSGPCLFPCPALLKRARSKSPIEFTLAARAVSLLAASAIGWVGWLIVASSRKQTPCRIVRSYGNNKANNNCGRVIAIIWWLAPEIRASLKPAYSIVGEQPSRLDENALIRAVLCFLFLCKFHDQQ
jgi:hypothetical protein